MAGFKKKNLKIKKIKKKNQTDKRQASEGGFVQSKVMKVIQDFKLYTLDLI